MPINVWTIRLPSSIFPKKELPWSEDKHRRKEKDKKHYTDFYDKRTENMIREVYSDDIRTWNYGFGD